MRTMSCRNVRQEIEEAAPGKWLSSNVNNHVLNCVACEKLLREQTKLRELVSSLGTVEAPSDFDFRLRARLADEKRRVARPFNFGNFSFGLRSVAVASILLVIGFALTFVSLKTRLSPAGPEGVATTAPKTGASGSIDPGKAANAGQTEGTGSPGKQDVIAEGGPKRGVDRQTQKRQNSPRQMAVASQRDTNRQSTRDSDGTRAAMLKRDQLAGVYPSSAFPIDGGYQSLRVSVDDGRGSSRTISLPSVSFGSQRSLSQGASPLMASARGAW